MSTQFRFIANSEQQAATQPILAGVGLFVLLTNLSSQRKRPAWRLPLVGDD